MKNIAKLIKPILFTCKQMLFLLIAALPPVKVLLMLEARLNDCEPSKPTTEPLKLDAPSPLTDTNSLLISSLNLKVK